MLVTRALGHSVCEGISAPALTSSKGSVVCPVNTLRIYPCAERTFKGEITRLGASVLKIVLVLLEGVILGIGLVTQLNLYRSGLGI